MVVRSSTFQRPGTAKLSSRSAPHNSLKHKGSFDMIHIKDAGGHTFATRMSNVFVIGKSNKPMVSLPKGKGIKLSIVEEQKKKFGTIDIE